MIDLFAIDTYHPRRALGILSMAQATNSDTRYTTARYFDLVAAGVLQPDDHVELLEGIIVAEPPQDPEHASGTMAADYALRAAIGDRGLIRIQLPLVLGPYSAPEPDVAVVAGRLGDYVKSHPTTALLVVEIARTSLPKDRLSKSRIYAVAGIPEYWIVNLPERCVEVFRKPDLALAVYADRHSAVGGAAIDLVALPGTRVAVVDLLPAV